MCYHSNEMAMEDPLQSKCTIHFLGFLKRKFGLKFVSWSNRANTELCKSEKGPGEHYF